MKSYIMIPSFDLPSIAELFRARKPSRLGTVGRAFFSQLIIAFGFLIFGLTHFAFANSQAARFVPRGRSQMARPVPDPVSVSGNLSWNDGVGKIQDISSGRAYVLENAEDWKSLWDSGVRKVALSGTSMCGAISVEDVSTP